jgi:hypothetical protein
MPLAYIRGALCKPTLHHASINSPDRPPVATNAAYSPADRLLVQSTKSKTVKGARSQAHDAHSRDVMAGYHASLSFDDKCLSLLATLFFTPLSPLIQLK